MTQALALTEQHVEIRDRYTNWLRSWSDSERTIQARRTMMTSRLAAWGLDGFTEQNVVDYLAAPKADGSKRSKWTRSTYYAHLNCICAWLLVAGLIPVNPMVNVRKPDRGSKMPRPLSEQEVARIEATVQPPTSDWIKLALLAGLRASEIAAIRGEDVQADGIYVDGKGGKREILPCHPDLWHLAQRYPRTGYWFPGQFEGHMRSQQISLRVGHLFRSLGIDGSIHRCRHVYATRLLRSGVNIRTVQKLMRHSNLDTTANYTAVDEDELRNAVNLLPSSSGPTAA